MADIRRLPTPVAEIWDWQLNASCRDMDSDLFFHPERERGPARAAREARAKQICQGCPVLQQCRDHALAVREAYGVWGGLSAVERDEQIRTATVVGVDFAGGHHRRSRVPTPDHPWPAA